VPGSGREPIDEPHAPQAKGLHEPQAKGLPEKPRIILPPGMSIETHDDLPEYPRMRAVQITAVRDGDRDLLIIDDPLRITPGTPVLGLESLAILQLLDGATSLNDLQALVMRESKDLRVGNMVREFVAKLDELLLLHSPRFDAALAEAQKEWHALEVRPAALEGLLYPAERPVLERYLDQHFAAAEEMRANQNEPAPAVDALPRALLAPHLDPSREGPVMARAYMEIGEKGTTPLRVVVFGTGHQLGDDFVALTRKRFETPLGQVPCDTTFVDRIAAKLGDAAYRRELVHRDEHSIEFQVLFLQRRLGARPWTLVPILCGGFHGLLEDGRTPREEPILETLIAAVREAERDLGGATLYVAGVDFSHVGPRFGEPPLDDEARERLRRTDGAALEAAATGDADAWFAAIAADQDATSICGFAPTYSMLRCAEPGAGRRLDYAASAEEDGSVVSVAAMVWP
jgi:hypothetical protein